METGVDIVEIERIQGAIRKHGQRFLERVFTPAEMRQCAGRAESLAARFAAKEAAFKVLGKRVGWREVEVDRSIGGKPRLILHGRAREIVGAVDMSSISVSLSHSRRYAVAVVVLVGTGGGE